VTSGRLPKRDLWKIYFDSCCVVEIVREDVQRDVSDDFRDFGVREADAPNGFDIGIVCQATLGHEWRANSRAAAFFGELEAAPRAAAISGSDKPTILPMAV